MWAWVGAASLLLATGAAAQDTTPRPTYLSSPRRAFTAPELKDAPAEWIDRSLQWAEDMLNRFPPDEPETPVRRAALIRLDDVLHIEAAPLNPVVQKFYRARMEKAIREIETTQTRSGAQIWKLYNHGFLVRTPTVAFTFDIVPGVARAPGFTVDQSLLERLADQSDALFISHRHGDHANQTVARLFLDRGKPVVAPEGLWADEPISALLTYPTRSTETVHRISVRKGEQVLRVVAFPGHQGGSPPLTNNVHMVTTPEGLTFMQTGDQSYAPDFEWLDRIGRDHRVDVLLPNCWTPDIQRVVRGVDPKLIITGHENEMGHTVDHREDYTQTYNHLFGVKQPFLVMAWGETYRYQR